MAQSQRTRIRLGSPLPPLLPYDSDPKAHSATVKAEKARLPLRSEGHQVTASSLLAAFSPRRSSHSLTHQRKMVTDRGLAPSQRARTSLLPSPMTSEITSPTPGSASSIVDREWTSFTPLTSPSDAEDVQPRAKRVKLNFAANEQHVDPDQLLASDDSAFKRNLRPRAPLKKRAGIAYGLRTSTAKPAIQQGKPAKLLEPTSRSQIRSDIASDTLVRQDDFLLHHQNCFLPLLPPKNHITKLGEARVAEGTQMGGEVSFCLLQQQPRGVRATLKDYQLTGLSFLIWLNRNGTSGILGDEMGLGKTLQTLSLFQHLEEEQGELGPNEEIRPYLVVCPLSVVGSWVSEAQKWTPNLTVLRFHGSTNERSQLKQLAVGAIDRYGNSIAAPKRGKKGKQATTVGSFSGTLHQKPFKLVVTSYEVFAAEQAWFKRAFVWRYVVLDEGHKIKNDVTQVSRALQGLRAEHRLILTGTPLQNNMLEMWALLHWLYPTVFTASTSELFKNAFDLTKGSVSTSVLDDTRRLLELICMRRMKGSQSVNLGLPSKTEVLLYVPLTPFQRLWYTRVLTKSDNTMLKELFQDSSKKEQAVLAMDQLNEGRECPKSDELEQWATARAVLQETVDQEGQDGMPKSLYQRLLNLVMQLRKVCSHPYLLPQAAPDPYTLGEHVVLASGKYLMLHKLINELVVNKGKKVLIISGFTGNLDLTEEVLALLGGGSLFKYARFDGSTPRARRNLAIRLFNASPEYKVMLISTRAGGLGINLATATEVIFLDEDWNPQVTLQAEARAHRIGQTQPVTIYKLCTQGTVEEQMLGRIRKKLYLSTKVTETMESVHERTGRGRGARHNTAASEMPHLDNSTLRSLIRRGAQTLVHPSIDAEEMLAWDFNTMLERCRDKPADIGLDNQTGATVGEEEWLRMMERVECAVFEGKKHARQQRAKFDVLPEDVTRADRRVGKNTTVMVDGHAINKESMLCGDWEAVPTLAGKDPRLAEAKREKKDPINSQDYCQACFDGGELVCCSLCPRALHEDCLDDTSLARLNGKGVVFACSQHRCADCEKNTTDAGGMLYRCRWCPRALCEDCLGTEDVEFIGDDLLEYTTLGFASHINAYYVRCPSCSHQQRSDKAFAATTEEMRQNFQKQHESAVARSASKSCTQVVLESTNDKVDHEAQALLPLEKEAMLSHAACGTRDAPIELDLQPISGPALLQARAMESLTSDARGEDRKKRLFGFL